MKNRRIALRTEPRQTGSRDDDGQEHAAGGIETTRQVATVVLVVFVLVVRFGRWIRHFVGFRLVVGGVDEQNQQQAELGQEGSATAAAAAPATTATTAAVQRYELRQCRFTDENCNPPKQSIEFDRDTVSIGRSAKFLCQ